MEGIIRFLPLFNKLESLIEKVNSDTKNQNLITRTILIHSVFLKQTVSLTHFLIARHGRAEMT